MLPNYELQRSGGSRGRAVRAIDGARRPVRKPAELGVRPAQKHCGLRDAYTIYTVAACLSITTR